MRIGRCGVITERVRCVVLVSFGKQNDLRTVTKWDLAKQRVFEMTTSHRTEIEKKPLHIGFSTTVEFC